MISSRPTLQPPTYASSSNIDQNSKNIKEKVSIQNGDLDTSSNHYNCNGHIGAGIGANERVTGPSNDAAMSIRSVPSRRSGWTIPSIIKHPKADSTRAPYPLHRHAIPSMPWSWIDLRDDVDPSNQQGTALLPVPPICSHSPLECNECWREYPQSRFPSWTDQKLVKSKIKNAIMNYNRESECVLHLLDVDSNGMFLTSGNMFVGHGGFHEVEVWKALVEDERPSGLRVRAFFLENLSGPVLQMLGTRYNIEPFFWSSALNWIPSRLQHEVQPGIGDHITITLTFVRSMANTVTSRSTRSVNSVNTSRGSISKMGMQTIDPQGTLLLNSSNKVLVSDLLAVHLVRNINSNTIISFHPMFNLFATTAVFLHGRLQLVGQSTYWQKIFQQSADPTLLLLPFIWHVVVSWDETVECLHDHLGSLETRVLETEHIYLTQELHLVRANNVRYASLLEDLSLHVIFIRDTLNPALDDLPPADRILNREIMRQEAGHLLTHIEKLGAELKRQDERLRNLKELTESRFVRTMTEATLRDSEAMKRIAFLTIFFLPASFIASIFGMNVSEINPGSFGNLWQFLVTAALLIWIIIAFQSNYIFQNITTPFTKRIAWPMYLAIDCINYIRKWISRKRREPSKKDEEMGHLL